MSQSMVSRGTAVFMALAAFAAGLFVGVVVVGELAPRPAQAPGGMPAAQSAPAAQKAAEAPGMSAAILELEKQTTLRPDDAALWTELGNAYYDSNQPAKSIAAYERSLAIRPGNPDVLTDMGIMHRALRQFDKAVAAFDAAARAAPGHVNSRLNKGVVLLHDLNDPAGAVAAWEELLKVQPAARAPDGRPLRDIITEVNSRNVPTGKGQ